MNDRNSLRLRAQEILLQHPEGMTTRAAMRQALEERFRDDPTGLLEYATGASDSLLRGLRQRTYELPEIDEATLFDIPPVIGISTPEGDLLISADLATLGQVRQWHREATQHIATQRLRRRRFQHQTLELLDNEPDELPWPSARALVQQHALSQQVAELNERFDTVANEALRALEEGS